MQVLGVKQGGDRAWGDRAEGRGGTRGSRSGETWSRGCSMQGGGGGVVWVKHGWRYNVERTEQRGDRAGVRGTEHGVTEIFK